MTQYMVTISAGKYSDLFNGYSTCGMYFRMYNKIANKLDTFDNETVIEPQKNGRPHVHSLFTTDIPLNDLLIFFEQFYDILKSPNQDTKDTWGKTYNKNYPNVIEHNYSHCIKLQENFTNAENYFEKRKDTGYQEASFIWYKSIQKIQNDKYKYFEKSGKHTKTQKNHIIQNFDDIDYNKWKSFIYDSTITDIIEFIKYKTHFTYINTKNKIIKPLNPFKATDLD